MHNYIGIYDESNIMIHCIKIGAITYGDAYKKFIQYLQKKVNSVVFEENVYIVELETLENL